MEEQTLVSSSYPASDSDRRRPAPSSHILPESTYLASSQTSVSSSSLRFPKPEGSHLLAHWVTSSSTNAADTMQASTAFDETSSLADSTYELISSTDGESQDGRGTDSLADSIAGSIDLYPRADDVLSLNGHEVAYDDDDDEEEVEDDGDESASDDGQAGGGNHSTGHLPTQTRNTPNQSHLYNINRGGDEGANEALWTSQADSIRYAEQALCNPSTQSLSTLDYDSSHGDISGGHTPLVQSIEFVEEPDVKIYLEKVSVKHTIREFTDDETSIIAANMGMTPEAPKRLAATIRQTMSHHCLSTREPLRVLYVGSDAAYNEIMYKISSALLASAPSPGSSGHGTEHRHASTPGIYNIMPISSFGSAKVPEIDEIQLMGVSDYYIKVERCTKADETIYEGEAFPNDTVYSINLDNDKTYLSVFCPSGSIVRPQWMLPHVAVFYVSGNDDRQAEKTRNAAWEFMTRHAVPSIFISHTQSFSRSPLAGRWQDFVDQAAVHLCLESRDPSRHISPERLPIDLASFLNIDARQMNRNLAYLTGLQDTPKTKKKASSKPADIKDTASIGGVINGVARSLHLLSQGSNPRPEITRTLSETGALLKSQSLRVLATAVITAILWTYLIMYIPLPSRTGFNSSQQIAPLCSDSTLLASSTGKPTSSADNAALYPTTGTSSVCSVPSVIPTVTISFITTETVQTRADPRHSLANEVRFGGFLTDRPHNQKSAKMVLETGIKRIGCTIQVYSHHEILVRVPALTKTTWLAKGAIDIDVWRGQKILKSKLSTTDEGIIIEINKMDAFGVMNVSIVTTRTPKINETFSVDFGKPTPARVLEAGLGLWQDSVRTAANTGREAASQAGKAIATFANDHGIVLRRSAQVAMGNASPLIHSARSQLEARLGDITRTYRQILDSTEWASQDVSSQFKRLGIDSVGKVVQGAQSLVGSSVEKTLQKAHIVLDGATRRWVPTDKVRDDVHLSVRRAQIASNLWWLRIQGKTKEYATYETKAAEYLREIELTAQAKANGRSGNVKKDKTEANRENPGRLVAWFW